MIFDDKVKALFKERESIYIQKEKTYNNLKEHVEREKILSHIIKMNTEEPVKKIIMQPIILGCSFYRMSVLNIGEVPKYFQKDHYNSNFIYPINFVSKRRYNKYNGCPTKSKEKIFYRCMIHDSKDIFEISCDYKKWTGKDCWEKFVSDFDSVSEYNSLEEFYGLTNPQLQRMIEEKGITELTDYIPLNERKKETEAKDDRERSRNDF